MNLLVKKEMLYLGLVRARGIEQKQIHVQINTFHTSPFSVVDVSKNKPIYWKILPSLSARDGKKEKLSFLLHLLNGCKSASSEAGMCWRILKRNKEHDPFISMMGVGFFCSIAHTSEGWIHSHLKRHNTRCLESSPPQLYIFFSPLFVNISGFLDTRVCVSHREWKRIHFVIRERLLWNPAGESHS